MKVSECDHDDEREGRGGKGNVRVLVRGRPHGRGLFTRHLPTRTSGEQAEHAAIGNTTSWAMRDRRVEVGEVEGCCEYEVERVKEGVSFELVCFRWSGQGCLRYHPGDGAC